MTQPATNLIKMPGVSSAPVGTPKTVKSTMDTVIITEDGLKSWGAPPFQRPLRVNKKVEAIAESLKHNGGVIPGVLTIGILNKMKYLIDGQHRIEAFKMSGLNEAYVDMRICHFDTMSEMAEEFANINSSIVKLRPDDLLRALEESSAGLSTIRKGCPFIGYDMIRRGKNSPVLSMSLALRSWYGSAAEVPTNAGQTASDLVSRLDTDESNRIVHFYSTCFTAWGRDVEYSRIWCSLNVTVLAWLWRRIVIAPAISTGSRVTRLTPQLFLSGMRALTASTDYMDWLVGRSLTDRDRSPCYERIKLIMAKRLQSELPSKIIYPAPPWATSGGVNSRKWAKRI